jgi:hypothetical protein
MEDDIVINGKKVSRLNHVDESDEGNGEENSDEDQNAKRINKMADELEGFFNQKKEYQMDKDRKLAKKDKKKKALIEQ